MEEVRDGFASVKNKFHHLMNTVNPGGFPEQIIIIGVDESDIAEFAFECKYNRTLSPLSCTDDTMSYRTFCGYC